MSPNRIVALLTPLVFAPLAGAVAAWLAEHFPGSEIDPRSLEQIFIAGALIALAPAAQWLHGWQKHEARQAELEHAVALAAVGAPAVASTMPADEQLAPFDEPEDALDDEDDGFDEDNALDALAGEDEPDDLDELDELGAVDAFDEDDALLTES